MCIRIHLPEITFHLAQIFSSEEWQPRVRVYFTSDCDSLVLSFDTFPMRFIWWTFLVCWFIWLQGAFYTLEGARNHVFASMRRLIEWALFFGVLRTLSLILTLSCALVLLWSRLGAFTLLVTSGFFTLLRLPRFREGFVDFVWITYWALGPLPLFSRARFWLTLFSDRGISFSPFSCLLNL